jgi:hypothetical protein
MWVIQSEHDQDKRVAEALQNGWIAAEDAHRLSISTPPRVNLELAILKDGRNGILTREQMGQLLGAMDTIGPLWIEGVHYHATQPRLLKRMSQ